MTGTLLDYVEQRLFNARAQRARMNETVMKLQAKLEAMIDHIGDLEDIVDKMKEEEKKK